MSSTDVNVTKMIHGSRYLAVSMGVTQLIRFATNVALARLIAPDDFGVVAIALVITMVLDQLKDAGTGSALIQRESVDQRLLNSVFALNLGLGAVLMVLLYSTAGPLARAMGSPDAVHVLEFFALLTFVGSAGNIHHALLRRELRFRELAILNTVGAVVTGVVAIACALAGAGYWALVLGVGAGVVVGTVMVWVYDRWRPTLEISLESISSIWRYSFHLFLSNLLFLLFNQVDKVIISRVLGAAPLGTYAMAQRMVTSPVGSVALVVSEVTFPAFSRRQHDDVALRSGFVRSARAVAAITFPAMFGLAALAGPAVDVLLGSAWSDMVPVIWALAPVAAVLSVTNNSSQLMLAKGRSDLSYRWGLVYCVTLTGCVLVGVQWGLTGAAVAYAVGFFLLAPPGLALAFRLVGLRLHEFVAAMAVQTVIALVMAGAAFAAGLLIEGAGFGSAHQLLGGFVVGSLVYAGLMLAVRPPVVDDLVLVVRHRAGEA